MGRKEFLPLFAGLAFLSFLGFPSNDSLNDEVRDVSENYEVVESFDFSNQKNVVVFSGHIPEIKWPDYPGAMSATEIREHKYNDSIVSLFENRENFNLNLFEDEINYITFFSDRNIIFKERVDTAKTKNPDIYLEIHHDSGYPIDIRRKDWDRLSGFSFHILPPTDSFPTKYYEESLFIAELMGDEFLRNGFEPNTRLRGGYELVDSARGIYHRTNLRILKDASMSMPAVLVEVGNIVNPLEEELISQPETRKKIANSIDYALRNYFLLKGDNQNSFNLTF